MHDLRTEIIRNAIMMQHCQYIIISLEIIGFVKEYTPIPYLNITISMKLLFIYMKNLKLYFYIKMK